MDDVRTDFPDVLATATTNPDWPDCVRWCGILPAGTLLAPAEDAQYNRRLLGHMQYMYAHVLEARMRAENVKFAAAQLSTGRDTVSWEWSPEELESPTSTVPVHLRLREHCPSFLRKSPEQFCAMRAWLGTLRWPQ